MANGASLAIDDCRVFGSSVFGVECAGKMQATRCKFEDNSSTGVFVYSGGEAKLMECMVRNNGRNGLEVRGSGAKVYLDGGAISDN